MGKYGLLRMPKGPCTSQVTFLRPVKPSDTQPLSTCGGYTFGNQASLNFVGKAAILGGAPRCPHLHSRAYGTAKDVWYTELGDKIVHTSE